MESHYRSPLIRQDFNGTYCLGFLNNHGLDIEEIRTIFSAFGEVVTIKETGDKTGYRFVRYQYADEAEKAVEGLKTHSKIRLVEHRPKPNRKLENQKNENKFQNGNANRKENRNNNFNGNRNENKYQNDNGYFKQDKQNFNENFEEETQNIKRNNKEIDQNSDEVFKEENENKNDKRFCEQNQVPKNSCSKENSSTENLLYNAKSCNSLNSNNDEIKSKITSIPSSLSNGSLNIEKDYCNLDDIPDLVTSEKLKIKNDAPKKTILTAEEIIVGNIPNEFGSAFILHLFERYNPIAISNINIVKNSGIRYCHVYFTTVQDSINVEKSFDQMNLLGQKLLVLRSCQLIQETVC